MVIFFLDTNVFLYAAGGDHPQRGPCQDLLHRIAAGQLQATTSSEVVQEILYVLTRRGLRREALQLGRNVLQLFPGMLEVGAREMAAACDLLESAPGLPPRDAVHAATMLTHDLSAIITADEHFEQIPQLQRIEPADA